jgi:hypothetical protein
MTADAPQETEEPGEVIDAALHSADSPPQANNVPGLGKIQPEDLESLMRPEVHAETAAMIREANALSRRKR